MSPVKPLVSIILILFLPAFIFAVGTGEDAEDNLVIYTYDAFPEALEESIVQHFGDTEVVLERYQDTGGLFTQLILEKEDPKADVAIGLDTTYLARAFAEELFAPYEPKNLQLVRDDLLVDPQYRVVPFDFGSVALNYDSEKLPNPPETWEELFSEEYRNQIILINPATSSPGKSFLLFTVAEFGEDGYLDFWRRIKPNVLTVTSGWSEAYGIYTQGEAPIVLSYDTSPAYHKHYEETGRYRNLLFEGKAYAQIEVAGILRGAPHEQTARRCMDHIVSVEFQDLIPLNQFMFPVHQDAAVPEAFSWAQPATEIVQIDAARIDANFDRWLAAWESVMR